MRKFSYSSLLILGLLAGCGHGGKSAIPAATVWRAVAPSAVAAGAALKEPASRPVAAEPFKPFSFVLAADPQIGFGSGGIAADQRRFVALARQVNELEPAFVLVAGDLTNWGTPAQWHGFDEALREFRVPVHLVMGNHDFQVHPKDDVEYFRRHYGRDYYSFTCNNCEFVALNASVLIRENNNAFYADQARAQWQWLEETLARAQANRRERIFLFMHQPPYVHDPGEKQGLLHSDWPEPQRKRLLDLARRYGVRDMLCGHLHRNIEAHSADLNIYVVGGTAVVWDNEPFGYRLFTVTQDGLEQRFVRLDRGVGPYRLATGDPRNHSAHAKAVTK